MLSAHTTEIVLAVKTNRHGQPTRPAAYWTDAYVEKYTF